MSASAIPSFDEFKAQQGVPSFEQFKADQATPTPWEQIKTSVHNQAKGLYETLHALTFDPQGNYQLGDQMVQAQADQWKNAKDAYGKGDYVGAVMGALGAAVPIIGPMINTTAEKMTSGGRPWEGAADLAPVAIVGGLKAAPTVAKVVPQVASVVKAGAKAAVPDVAAGVTKAGIGLGVGTAATDLAGGSIPSYVKYAATYPGVKQVGAGLVKGLQAAKDEIYNQRFPGLANAPAGEFPSRGKIASQLRAFTPGEQQYGAPSAPTSYSPAMPGGGAPSTTPPPLVSPEDFPNRGMVGKQLRKFTPSSPDYGQTGGQTTYNPAMPGGGSPTQTAPAAAPPVDFPNRGLLKKQLMKYTPGGQESAPARVGPRIKRVVDAGSPPELESPEEVEPTESEPLTRPPSPKVPTPEPLPKLDSPEPSPATPEGKIAVSPYAARVGTAIEGAGRLRNETISKYLNDKGLADQFANGSKITRQRLVNQFNRDLDYKQANQIDLNRRHTWSERDPERVSDMLNRLDTTEGQ